MAPNEFPYTDGVMNCIFLFNRNKKILMSGEVPEELFWLLIELSHMHSEKVILALRDYLVYGHSRKTVCMRHSVNNGYLSTSLNRLSCVNQIVYDILPFYSKEVETDKNLY